MARTEIQSQPHRELSRRWTKTSGLAGAGVGVVYAIMGSVVGFGEFIAGLLGIGSAVVLGMAAGRSHGILRRMLLAGTVGVGVVGALVLLVVH